MGRTPSILHRRPWAGCQPLERLFRIVPDHYAYVLLRTLDHVRRARFSRLQEALAVNSRTLTLRLKQLARFGLIERRAYRTMPPRVEYRLTGRGRELANIIRRLDAWAERHCRTVPTPRQRP